MTATLGGGDDTVIEHRVCQESFEETSQQAPFSGSYGLLSFGDDAEGVGSCCREGREDQRCLHQGSSNEAGFYADQEVGGIRRVSMESSSPVLLLSSLTSDIEDVSEAVGKFSEFSKAGVDEVGNGGSPGRGS